VPFSSLVLANKDRLAQHFVLEVHKKDDGAIITPELEAFCLILYDNCHAKWTEVFKYYDENPTKKKLPERLKRQDPDPKNVMRFHKGLYTDAYLGQQKNGGWSEKGLEEYVKIRDALLKDRKKNPTKYETQDQIFLDQIRAEEGVTEDTPELEANKKRRGKNKNKNTKGVNSTVK